VAIIYYSGNQRTRAIEYAVTVSSVSATQTIIATVNGKAETYVSTTATAATAASEAVDQFSNSLLNELRQFTFTADGAVIRVVGPANGAPVAIAWSGTATLSGTTATVTALSPNDVDDAANYVGGSKPVDGDTLVIENTGVDLLWNLAEFTANTVNIIRRASHTGRIGLDDVNPLGYPEYLPTHLETAGTTHIVEDGGQGTVRMKSTAGSAVTFTVTGTGAGSINSENVELFGTPASSVINVNGGSLAFCPLSSQTGTGATVRLANCAFRSGSGATLGAVTASGSQVVITGAYTTYVQGLGTASAFGRASAAGTSTTINDGTVTWGSTGTFGALTINSNGTFDASLAPATVTPGAITINEGGTFLDPNRRVARSITFTKNGELRNMTIDLGDGTDTLTVS
jgi:hypothetical protein